MITNKTWNFFPDNLSLQSEFSSKLGISEILARILVNREITSTDEAARYLSPKLNELHDPFLMSGMKEAVEIICKAMAQKKKFLIYGDYDVDGVTSTCLLLKLFKLLNTRVTYYIPNRITEGYSMTEKGLQAVLDSGAEMVISVDNGISSLNEVRYLKEKGITVVITDHHEPPDELPPADAIINPKQKDCPYPFKSLAGVGVAFKLAWGVAQGLYRNKKKVAPELRKFLLEALAWVAMGTITDLVPLKDENRALSRFGLSAIQSSGNPGLLALCEVSRNVRFPLFSDDISFRLGPRINAAGRMGEADKAVRLFMAETAEEAKGLAVYLDSLNRDRQVIEKEILQDALSRDKEISDKVIVMADETWHAGVIGIVASKLVEIYAKPACLVALHNGMGKGSCRSMPGLDMHAALQSSSELLEAFGGHALAGGFQIREQQIDAFRDRIIGIASENEARQEWTPSLDVDSEIFLSSLTPNLLSEIDKLTPLGEGNAVPVFVSSGLELAATPQVVGHDQRHLSFRIRQGKSEFKAIAFGMSADRDRLLNAASIDLAYTPRLNFFGGRTSIEIDVQDIRTG